MISTVDKLRAFQREIARTEKRALNTVEDNREARITRFAAVAKAIRELRAAGVHFLNRDKSSQLMHLPDHDAYEYECDVDDATTLKVHVDIAWPHNIQVILFDRRSFHRSEKLVFLVYENPDNAADRVIRVAAEYEVNTR